ncbi:MAG: LapA family protein [Acidobacteriota bacterium]
MKHLLKIIVLLALALLLVGVAMLNAGERVDVALMPSWVLEDVPVFVVILGSMFVGVLVAGAVSVVDYLRARARIRSLERRLRQAGGPRQGAGAGDGK